MGTTCLQVKNANFLPSMLHVCKSPDIYRQLVTERNAFHIVVTVRMSRDETTFFAQTPSASDSADVDDEISSLVKHSSGNTAPVVEEQKTDIPCKNLPGTKITLLTMEQVLIELLTRERPIYFLTVCSGIIYYTR